MMQFTEEHKKALAGLCNIEIKRWKAASESNPNMRYMVELMETALAALTAEPIGRVDRGEVSDSNEYPDARVVCLHDQADWENFPDGTELFLHPAPAVSLNAARAEGVELFGDSDFCPEEMSPAINEFAAQLRSGIEEGESRE